MKTYFMSIMFAVLISVFAGMILPDKWDKYIKIITGLIIISTIITPLKKSWDLNYNEYTLKYDEIETDAAQYRQNLVVNELSNKIKNDIEQRIFDEFGSRPQVSVSVGVNSENEITGIERIELNGDNLSDEISARLTEIYAPQEVIINGSKKNN